MYKMLSLVIMIIILLEIIPLFSTIFAIDIQCFTFSLLGTFLFVAWFLIEYQNNCIFLQQLLFKHDFFSGVFDNNYFLKELSLECCHETNHSFVMPFLRQGK